MEYIFSLNYIIALLVTTLFLLKRKSLQHVLAAFLICLCFPVGGIVLLWIFYPSRIGANSFSSKLNRIGKLILLGSQLETGGMNEIFMSNIETDSLNRFTSPTPAEDEANVVPLEETFLISDYHQRRKTILNILKRDVSNYSELINLALRNEDSETSHYAASGYMNIKRKLDNRMREIQSLYKKHPNDKEVTQNYAEVLHLYLYTTGLGKDSRGTYLIEYVRVLLELINHHKDPDIKYMKHLLVCLLELGDDQSAALNCQILEKNYPETEEKYLTLLNGYFSLNDKANFDRLLTRFRASDIRFSKGTLDIIRFWLGDEI